MKSGKRVNLIIVVTLLVFFGLMSGCSGNGENQNDAGADQTSQERASSPQAAQKTYGTASWGQADPQPFNQVRCGFSTDVYTMTAEGDGFSIRIMFPGLDGEDSVDFSNPQSIDLRFAREHQYAGARFHLSGEQDLTGQISANPDGARGEAELIYPMNPGSADLDELMGSLLSYEFECSHDLNYRQLRN